MANDLNQVTLTGRLGADPEIRSAGSSRVANLRLAVSEQWKDKSGERQERTEWASVTVWGDGLVGVVESYVKKGSKLLVQGKMQTRKWQDKDGNDRYTTEVVLQGFDSKLILLDTKKDNENNSSSFTKKQEQKPNTSNPKNNSSFDDEDVPF